jgi:hypothetical protein
MPAMKERLTQLGLVGFGKEVDSQQLVATEIAVPTVTEVEPKTFIIPQNTTIFRRLNSDLGMTALGSFYVTKKDGVKAERGVIKVEVVDGGVEVYRDGQRFTLIKGETIEVSIKRLVKKTKGRV